MLKHADTTCGHGKADQKETLNTASHDQAVGRIGSLQSSNPAVLEACWLAGSKALGGRCPPLLFLIQNSATVLSMSALGGRCPLLLFLIQNSATVLSISRLGIYTYIYI